MRTIVLSHTLPDAGADALGGTLLDDSAWDTLLFEDCDVFKPDGEPLLKFRRGVLPTDLCRTAWENLRAAARMTENRGLAGGIIESDKDAGRDVAERQGRGARYRPRKQDGTVSNTNYAKPVQSGIVGYFDRHIRFPYCRLTAYNLEEPERFHAALPFFRAIDSVFAQEAPERYAAQKAYIERTHPDFYIHGTVFTTVTVNRNWQTAVHKDQGDLKEGFGVMSVLQAGVYEGCYLCFPAYRIAVDMRTADVLLADVHEWHGNTPLRGRPGGYERLSCVLYYREHMKDCGSAAEELARAKGRKRGDRLHG